MGSLAHSKVDVLARKLSLVDAVVIGFPGGVRFDELRWLLLDSSLERRLEPPAWNAGLDGAPHLTELRRVRQRARVEGRQPGAEQQPAVVDVVTGSGPRPSLVELPRGAAVVDDVVVQEGELAWLLDELVPQLQADLLHQIDGLHLVLLQLADAVDVLRVFDVRRRQLGGELPLVGHGPDGQGDDTGAAFPDALDRLVQLLDQHRRAVHHLVVDGDRRRHTGGAADRGGAHAKQRNDVAPAGEAMIPIGRQGRFDA
mmetsp:Transcript_3937/g.13015  ORF Transcript_3937/g.13015 Transcript_3937/m.13015 type:complete len:256 (-) Transcript_3937:27-794(-)